jgi:single-strand DNA-binding protein
MSTNLVILVGNVGSDPEIRNISDGVKVANFSIATSETFTNKNGEKSTNTEWHKLVAWNSIATVCEKYVKKGSQIFIQGKLKTRSYDDKDSVKHYTTEIYVTSLQLLGRKPDGANETTE